MRAISNTSTMQGHVAILQLFDIRVTANLAHIAAHPASCQASIAAASFGLRPFIGHPLGITQPPLSATRYGVVCRLAAKTQGPELLAEHAIEELIRRRSKPLQ